MGRERTIGDVVGYVAVWHAVIKEHYVTLLTDILLFLGVCNREISLLYRICSPTALLTL